MIKISISEQQKNKIEKIYWEWMYKYHLKSLIAIIENDCILRKYFFPRDKDIEEAIKKYLLADDNELLRIKSCLDKMRHNNECVKENTKDFFIARYKNYRDSQAAKVINILDISVCPYCNQNHINIVFEKNGQVRFWGDLDHFYDISTYPELAICLYNLIPVCKVCNQLKSSQKGNIINPYNSNVNSNIKFRTTFDEKLDLDYLQGRSQNFNIIIEKDGLTMADEDEIVLFDLENRYSNLKQNVQEIIIKSKAYDSLYQKMLIKEFDISDEELSSLIFGYSHNHLNRVLSKFNLDIMQEFRGLKE